MARIVGIDITPHHLRCTLVQAALRRVEVLRYVEVPLSFEESDGTRAEIIGGALRTALAAFDRPPEGAISMVEGREASLRLVELPLAAAKRASEVLPFELEALLPFPVEDAIVDYQPVEHADGKVRLLTASVPKGRIAKHIEELSNGGIDPREVAVGAAALDGLVPLFPMLQTGGPHLLIDVGPETTDLCFLRQGSTVLARTLTGGADLFRQGKGAFVESQLRQTMATHLATGGTLPERAFVSGEIDEFPDLVSWFGDVVGSEASVLPLPPVAGAGDAERPRFARSTALATRAAARTKRINLRQGEFAVRRAMGAMRKQVRLLAICVPTVLLAFVFSTYARWSILDDEREILETELGALTEELFQKKVIAPDLARELLATGNRIDDPLPRFGAYDVLSTLSALVPAEIKHDTRRLHIDVDQDEHKGKFELMGSVASIAERDVIASKIEEHECFVELAKGRTSPTGTEGLNYQLDATVRCPGSEPEERSKGGKGTGNASR